MEVKLCGHATLASAYVIKRFFDTDVDIIDFNSLSGVLQVDVQQDVITLRFPVMPPMETEFRSLFLNCFDEKPTKVVKGSDFYFFEFDDEDTVRRLKPEFSLISLLDDVMGIVVTAKGDDSDYVCRLFAPQSGINEDPVTGSVQTTLAPYWSERLGKTKMQVSQLSQRGGDLEVECKDEYVYIGGTATLYSKGEIYI